MADKDKLVTLEDLGVAYDDNKNKISDLKSALSEETENMFYFTNSSDEIFSSSGRNGIIITRNSDGSFIINGTATENINICIGENPDIIHPKNPWLTAGTYSFGIEVVSGNYSTGADFSLRANNSVVANLTTTPSSTETFGSEVPCYAYIKNGAVLTNLKIKCIINTGNTLMDYAPHITACDYLARETIVDINDSISDIQGDISTITTNMTDFDLNQSVILYEIWESGSIDGEGQEGENAYRFRMKQIMSYKYDMEISVEDGYKGYICFYNASGVFLFRSSPFSIYAVPANTKFRMMVKSDNDTHDDGFKKVRFSGIGYAGYLHSKYDNDKQSLEFISILRNDQLSSTGAITTKPCRTVTFNSFTVGTAFEVNVQSGYAVDFGRYEENTYTRTGYMKGTFVLPPGEYKASVMAEPEDTESVANVVEFANAVTIKLISRSAVEIVKDSFNYGIEYPKNFEISDIMKGATVKPYPGEISYSRDIHYQNNFGSYILINDKTNNPCDFRITLNTPIEFYGIQEFAIAVYIPDASNVNKMAFGTLSQQDNWLKYINGPFNDGWNFIRASTNGTAMDEDVTEDKFRIYIYYNTASVDTSVYLCDLRAIKPPHANIIFVDDGPYYSFYQLAYPLLKEINCPVTWAMECAAIPETRTGTRPLISLSDLHDLEDDGISEFSWHGYNGELTANLTAEETAEYNLKCIRFLSRRGDLNGKIFRAVWPGNTAPNYQLAIEDLDASATYNAASGNTIYPYIDKYNIPRTSLQTRTETWINNLFDTLRKTRATAYVYTHGIIDSEEYDPNNQDMRLDMFEHFVEKISDGIEDGWLKATTYNRLEREYWK